MPLSGYHKYIRVVTKAHGYRREPFACSLTTNPAKVAGRREVLNILGGTHMIALLDTYCQVECYDNPTPRGTARAA
jgi:hypothetical protein